MKKYIFTFFCFFYFKDAYALQCISGGKSYEVSKCKDTLVCVKNSISNTVLEKNVAPGDEIKCMDVNFDGEDDILIAHPPSGQVQMSSVYVFNTASATYEENTEISALPCLEVDAEKKTISGTCFSSSVCEHWTERYKYGKAGLELSAMEGTYCDPATGTAYSYLETYKNGKISERIVKELKNNIGK